MANYGLLKGGNPYGNPTTLADRSAARLVNSMERDDQGITRVYLAYLPLLPNRLADSPCLRDVVELFCSAWTDFRRRQPQGDLMGMPQYGKALRSLSRALSGSQARNTETLAAMMLLDRTSTLFDRNQRSHIHVRGIRQAFINKGPPNMEDELDVDVTNEVNGLMVSHPG